MNPPPSIFRVNAHNSAVDSENKIHDDRIAVAYGFRGGLVPGVTIYGYMIPPILEQLGQEWMEHGGINVRFVAPCYEGETVVTRCDGSVVTAEREDGFLYASGVVTMNESKASAPSDAEVWVRAVYPIHPLPETSHRPSASCETIVPGKLLGTLRRMLEAQDAAAFPERLLYLANDILVQNFKMSPWLHAGSEVRHHCVPALGREITVTGKILECFERKRRRFAVAGLSFSQSHGPGSGELLASVRHAFIYELDR
ncbi:MAG TPA: hypothetical protein VIX19_05375 [Terriglobales bacterium]